MERPDREGKKIMAWYFSEFEFETTCKKLMELERMILSGGNTRREIMTGNGLDEDEGPIRFIEGKNSSFLRKAEDYLFWTDHRSAFIDEEDTEDYSFGISVGAVDPDTKRIITDKIKVYLDKEKIEYRENLS